MNQEQIDKIIAMLEAFRKYPQMYTGRVDIDLTLAYLHGFEAGLRLYDNNQPGKLRSKVTEERGWQVNALHPSSQMRERGMTPEAIVDEILVIEIEAWKRVTAQGSPRQGWEEAFQAMAAAGDDALLDGDTTQELGHVCTRWKIC